jgi:hypothetical protein
MKKYLISLVCVIFLLSCIAPAAAWHDQGETVTSTVNFNTQMYSRDCSVSCTAHYVNTRDWTDSYKTITPQQVGTGVDPSFIITAPKKFDVADGQNLESLQIVICIQNNGPCCWSDNYLGTFYVNDSNALGVEAFEDEVMWRCCRANDNLLHYRSLGKEVGSSRVKVDGSHSQTVKV